MIHNPFRRSSNNVKTKQKQQYTSKQEYCELYKTLSAIEKKEEVNDKKYLRKEITESSYQRSFYLENINEDKIKAKLEDGILNIRIEKLKPEIKNKKIRIE